jgi:cell division inhibitor SepF
MATFVHRAFVYLGLVDDDDYDDYADAQLEGESVEPASRPSVRVAPLEPAAASEPAPSAVRTLTREATTKEAKEDPAAQGGGSSVNVVGPRPAVVRPVAPEKSARVHVVAPAVFADAQEIGDRMRASQPVIVNLQGADRELGRRMIDFCSGVTYGVSGTMEKVADQVFLLTPSNVEVSEEERQRLHERGLYRL